ncbi:glycosyltransferase family 4 protein [Methylomonas rhizoryzae]|uniref:glycosyltransferase family 4 protein n=1 Tax=Methylomonas rhizoryzae TaxID=2608981 RepID=UPI001232853F|nr:glycosyltransferase family 4 protein [Methylomonas rhizoryzae]
MRIAFITSEYPTEKTPHGGLAAYLKKTSYFLASKGHEAYIILLSNRNYYWKDNEVHIYEIDATIKFSNWINDVPLLRILCQFLVGILVDRRLFLGFSVIDKSTPFDIVQIPILPYGEVLGLYILRKFNRAPVVCRLSCFPPAYFAHLKQRKIIDCLNHMFTIYKLNKSAAVFSPCKSTSELTYRKTKVEIETIYTVVEPGNIVLDYTVYDKSGVELEYILYFNQFDPIKGIDVIADAVGSILDRYNHISFVFIGQDNGVGLDQIGHTTWQSYIKSKCDISVLERLYFFSPLNRSQLFPFIMNAKAVLIPSKLDNYPNACLEALFLETPVIGTYESSLEEMIIDGRTGFLAENSDPESLKKAIHKLLSLSPEELKLMKNYIRQNMKKVVAEDRIGRLLEFYQSVVDKHNH